MNRTPQVGDWIVTGTREARKVICVTAQRAYYSKYFVAISPNHIVFVGTEAAALALSANLIEAKADYDRRVAEAAAIYRTERAALIDAAIRQEAARA